MSEEVKSSPPMKRVHTKTRKSVKTDALDKLRKNTRCSLGEKRCRACAKCADHKDPPKYITCIHCGAIHNFFHLRTGRIRREKIYLEDANGERIMRYDQDGNSLGFAWAPGDKMYYEDGTSVPETKFSITCGSDCCKFYKIPIKEVQKYAENGKDLNKI